MTLDLRRHLSGLAGACLLLSASAAPARAQAGSIATERIFEAIGVRAGITVCEIGAGDGALSIEAARIVGPTGRVYTSELGEERVKALTARVAESGLSQITVVTGDPVKTNFADGACDALFMRNVYHHFGDPPAMNRAIAASLKPGARAAVVDFTPPGDEAASPGDRGRDGMHGIKPDTLSRELSEAGLVPAGDVVTGGRWFMVVVGRPGTF